MLPHYHLLLLTLLPCLTLCEYAVRLMELSTIRVATSYDEDGQAVHQWNSTNEAKMAFDKLYNIVYVAGGSYIHLYQLKNLSDPVALGRTENEPGYEFVDVQVCGTDLFALSVNKDERMSYCRIYAKYDENSAFLTTGRLARRPGFRIADIARSMYVTRDCRTVVITTRGQAHGKGSFFRDPPSTVNVLHLPEDMSGVTDQVLENMLLVNNFEELNEYNRTVELEEAGYRYLMKFLGVRLSGDTDAADVTVDEKAGKIYVTLQINNAIAELDLESANLTRVSPLGFKDWRNLVIDPSSEGRKISFDSYPIYSYYLPGAIKLLHQEHLNNQGIIRDDYRGYSDVYLVTANEGAHKDYTDSLSWTEIITGQEMVEKDLLLPTVEASLRADLANLSRLGGLEFTKRYGDYEPEWKGFSRFVTLGGRGFSVWRAYDFRRIYDSEDIMEKRHAQFYPMLFNCRIDTLNRQIAGRTDEQSTQKGLEPSVIEIGHEGALTLLFVGSRHPGSVTVFSVLDDITQPRFEDLWAGIRTDNPYGTWGDALRRKRLSGVGVSDIIFIPSDGLAYKKPLLLVTGQVSSTLSIMEVDIRGKVPGSSDMAHRHAAAIKLLLASVLLAIMLQVLM